MIEDCRFAEWAGMTWVYRGYWARHAANNFHWVPGTEPLVFHGWWSGGLVTDMSC